MRKWRKHKEVLKQCVNGPNKVGVKTAVFPHWQMMQLKTLGVESHTHTHTHTHTQKQSHPTWNTLPLPATWGIKLFPVLPMGLALSLHMCVYKWLYLFIQPELWDTKILPPSWKCFSFVLITQGSSPVTTTILTVHLRHQCHHNTAPYTEFSSLVFKSGLFKNLVDVGVLQFSFIHWKNFTCHYSVSKRSSFISLVFQAKPKASNLMTKTAAEVNINSRPRSTLSLD